MARKPKTTRAPKATQFQVEQRIEFCMRLMSNGHRKGDIKRQMRAKFKITSSSVEKTYIPRARERLLENLRRDRAEIKAESLDFYESIIADPKARHCDKLTARKRIDQLLGLNAPLNLELTGAGGGPIKTETIHTAMGRILTDPDAHEAASVLGSRLNGTLTAHTSDGDDASQN